MSKLALASKCCLVTGAGRGIGQAIAEAFAKEGAKLLLAARSEEQLRTVSQHCKDLGASEVQCYAVDLTDPKEVRRAVRSRSGPLKQASQ